MAAEPLNDNWMTRVKNSFLCITFYFELLPFHVIQTDMLTSVLSGAKNVDRPCLESSYNDTAY